MTADSTPRTLVVQALPGIGDALWNLAACRAIAAASPGGRVVLAAPARTQSRQLFAAEGWNGGVIDLIRGRAGALQLARRLRAMRLERGFVLHHSPSLGFALWAGGVHSRAGFGIGMQRLWLNRGAPIDPRVGDHHARLEAFLAAQAIASHRDQPPLALAEDSRARIAARFGGLPPPRLVIAIGASEAFKRWPEARYASVIDRLDKTTWPTILLAGGPQDEPAGRRILAAVARGGVLPAFDLPLSDAAALIADGTLVLGNDSGLLNLALALKRRCIGLFGATPALAQAPLLTALVPPSGGAARGMEAIEVEAVLSAIAACAR